MKRFYIGFIMLLFTFSAGAQTVGVKTNLLYLATGTPNLGVEFGLGRRLTMSVAGGFNPLRLEETRVSTPSLEHWMGNASLRYWVCQRFDGLFVGAEGVYGDFTVEDIPLVDAPKDYRYKGTGYTMGVVWGSHGAWGRRWGIALSGGMGVGFLEYDKFGLKGGQKINTTKFDQSYVGPTKLNFSLMYFFK
jgi:hypothetical protein